jgi:hypothetical protein
LSLSPVPFFAIAPAAKLAVRGAAQLVESGRDFASYLAHKSETPIAAKDSSAVSDLLPSRIDQLLQPLKQFLREQGYDSAEEITLVADGTGQIRVDADPGIKEAVEGWLSQNPEWSHAWQSETTMQLSQLGVPNIRMAASIGEGSDFRLPTVALRQTVLL